jgi:hypothetical protein
MISPLRITNDEIAEQLRYRIRRESERRRLERPIEEVDQLISECEELLLVGRKRVPLCMEERLGRLAASLAPRTPELHAGVTIVRLMDQLFDVQAELLGRRTDRAAYPDADDLN